MAEEEEAAPEVEAEEPYRLLAKVLEVPEVVPVAPPPPAYEIGQRVRILATGELGTVLRIESGPPPEVEVFTDVGEAKILRPEALEPT